MNQSFEGFVLTPVVDNGFYFYKAKSEGMELVGSSAKSKLRALFNIQFEILCAIASNEKLPVIVLSPFTNPSSQYLNLSTQSRLGKDFSFPHTQKMKLYVEGKVEFKLPDKTIKVSNKMFETDPPLIYVKVLNIQDKT